MKLISSLIAILFGLLFVLNAFGIATYIYPYIHKVGAVALVVLIILIIFILSVKDRKKKDVFRGGSYNNHNEKEEGKEISENDKKKSETEFNNIVKMAQEIINSDSYKRVFDLIYVLGKPKQASLIIEAMKNQEVEGGNYRSLEDFFFKTKPEPHNLVKFVKDNNLTTKDEDETVGEIKVNPRNTLILTVPWKWKRLRNAFLNIGENVGNKWEYDKSNHIIMYVLPLKIAIVENGNHSIAMNVINNEVEIPVSHKLDITPVYDEIYTDGRYFRKKDDHSIVAEVDSLEFAAIFEIGRLIIQSEKFKELS